MNVQQDLLVSENNANDHFSKIASNYKELRTTDVDHIEYIKNILNKNQNSTLLMLVVVMDVIL